MDFFNRLSRRQRRWSIGTLIAILGILGCGWLVERSGHQDRSISVSADQTIRQLAPALGTTGFAIAREFGLARTVDKNRPLSELGIGQEQLDGVATHLLSHQGRRFKYFVYAALVLFGWVFLVQLGRPDGSSPADRKHWYPRMLFIVMLLLLFGIVGGKKGFVIYHFLNPFNLFNWEFEALPIWITVVVVIGLAWITYRPFCMWICPFGFVSWLAERFNLFGLRIDHTSCNACGACARACPVDAAKHRVEKKRFAADCYSYGRCLTVCPHESISYGPLFKYPSGKETSAVADR